MGESVIRSSKPTTILNVRGLSDNELEAARAEVVSEINIRRQRAHLQAFTSKFTTFVDSAFQQTQSDLLASFIELVNSLQVIDSEAAFESTSYEVGSVKLSVPGLPEGVTVSRTTDTFLVNEGSSLQERNEIRIKVGGLDAYSGYWLALDSPFVTRKEALQEEGLDTLQRLIASVGIPIKEGLVVDALQYPFVAALLSPFGPKAICPFEEHLSVQHLYYEPHMGGSWFKVPSDPARRKSAGKRPEDRSLAERPRAELSTFEQAELEIEKLDL